MSKSNMNFLQSSKNKYTSSISNPVKTLFDESPYEFDKQEEVSEFAKIYRGEKSELDRISLQQEYLTPKRKKKQQKMVDDNDIFHDEDETEDFVYTPIRKQDYYDEQRNVCIIQGRAELIEEDDEEKRDCALAIAEEFVLSEDLAIIGDALYIYNGRFYEILSDEGAQKLIFKRKRREISRGNPITLLRNASALLKYCTEYEIDEFPVNSHIIVFENGTLEVATGHFRKNKPKDLASSALGISYDATRWEMPYTKKFIKTIANGDDDLYELILQVIGYILSNDIKAKSFFYLEGVGDAGKSRFCDLIASFFPASGTNKVARVALQDLGGKFTLGNLVNTKLNISEDLPDSPLSPTTVSRIKMLSDGNRLEAEAKYVQPFSFRPMCKLLFASNHPLRLKEYDAAFVNRVVYIPFLHAIPKEKQDKDILKKMKTELPALFNHAFEAYRRLVANGYAWSGAEKFKPRISVVSSGISYDKERVLRQFINVCCLYQEDFITPTAELQYAYQQFCCEKNYVPIMGDRFARELLAVLPDTVERVKIGNQKRGFKGIKLKLSQKEIDW